jgi:nuclear transport factor 2 (NTF2) superfamily protein
VSTRPPLPPFTEETARQKVQAAENAWNTRDPQRVSLAYTEDSVWRNRDTFITGRDAIVAFLTAKWERELDYALRKELWAFEGNRIAVRFQYESHDRAGRVLPGGVANPDQLRMEPAAVNFLRSAVQAGKPIAVICHGPWTLVEADAVRGRTLTSWPSLQTDIRNAGGTWVDTEVQVCTSGPNVLVSSRKPDDLPAFCAQFVSVFQQEARPA